MIEIVFLPEVSVPNFTEPSMSEREYVLTPPADLLTSISLFEDASFIRTLTVLRALLEVMVPFRL